jgi:hypothetical protein
MGVYKINKKKASLVLAKEVSWKLVVSSEDDGDVTTDGDGSTAS